MKDTVRVSQRILVLPVIVGYSGLCALPTSSGQLGSLWPNDESNSANDKDKQVLCQEQKLRFFLVIATWHVHGLGGSHLIAHLLSVCGSKGLILYDSCHGCCIIINMPR